MNVKEAENQSSQYGSCNSNIVFVNRSRISYFFLDYKRCTSSDPSFSSDESVKSVKSVKETYGAVRQKKSVGFTRALVFGCMLYLSLAGRRMPVIIDYSKQNVWELGVVIHEVVTGRSPFAGEKHQLAKRFPGLLKFFFTVTVCNMLRLWARRCLSFIINCHWTTKLLPRFRVTVLFVIHTYFARIMLPIVIEKELGRPKRFSNSFASLPTVVGEEKGSSVQEVNVFIRVPVKFWEFWTWLCSITFFYAFLVLHVLSFANSGSSLLSLSPLPPPSLSRSSILLNTHTHTHTNLLI